jgi:ceramide glucosyltransferase
MTLAPFSISAALSLLGWTLLLAAWIGAAYRTTAAMMTRGFLSRTGPPLTSAPDVTVLKPLHGVQKGLLEALGGLGHQAYGGRVQVVLGIQRQDDPALQVADAFQRRHPALDVETVIDGRRHGDNPKISNLINMQTQAKYEVWVLSDADIVVADSYIGGVVAALTQPGVGAVTCLYVGRPQGGLWARLAAMAIDYGFLPNAILGSRAGLAHPCFGSTIALSRSTLEAVGGLSRFADILADDFELGRSVRALGLKVDIPPFVVGHLCTEESFRALWRHEIRWARTIRAIDPAGYLGSLVTHPLPLALVALALLPGSPFALAAIFLSAGVRFAEKIAIDRSTGSNAGPLVLLPARDMLSFAVFVASLAGSVVDWQGARLDANRVGRPNRN